MSESKSQLRSYLPDRANGALVPAACAMLLAAALVVQIGLPAGSSLADTLVAGRSPQYALPSFGEPGAIGLGPKSLFQPRKLAGTSVDGETSADGAPVKAPVRYGPLGPTAVLGSMRIGNRRVLVLKQAEGRVLHLAAGARYRGLRLVTIGATSATFGTGSNALQIAYAAAPPSAKTDDSDSENTNE